MSRIALRRISLIASASLVAFAACSDATSPIERAPASRPSLAAQPSKGVWTVTSLDDPGVGSCTSSSCTLRQAVAAAQDGERIVFKSALSGTIALTAGEISLNKDVAIDGGSRITIDASNTSRIFIITGENVALSGLAFTRGFAPTFSSGGGAVLVGAGNLVISNSVFTDNHAASSLGGAISTFGNTTIIGTSISNNTAEHGGGIWSGGPLSIVRSTVSANAATNGGGIYIEHDAVILAQSTISGNTALQGGGVGGSSGSLSLRSTTLTSNFASLIGGGVSFGGSVSAANSILAGNSAPVFYDCDGPVFTSYGHNVSSGCLASTTDIVVSVAQFFAEVIEPTLKNNGGPTMTHALIERGRAVDAGYCPGETVDQRGFARPYDDTRMANAVDGCDIGAFEWRPATVPKGSK